MKRSPAASAAKKSRADEAEAVVASLRSQADQRVRDEMESRYGIRTKKAFGMRMSTMQKVAKELGPSHELAEALWKTGWYEARTVAVFVDEPERVTAQQMDRWARDFDNWAICDTACFKLFDRTPHAFGKVVQWARSDDEFVKRAAFALLASLAAHDRNASDPAFAKCLPLVERAASDDRNFVKKGVLWALRSVGGRSAKLRASVVELAERLAASEEPAARWVGKGALRELGVRAARRSPAKR
jgi:3-methyladenine DNA glycosylase AlkD